MLSPTIQQSTSVRRHIALLVPLLVLAACSESSQATGPENVATLRAGSAARSASPAASAAGQLTTIADINSTFTNDFDCPFPLCAALS